MGIFGKIKAALKKTKDAITYRLNKLFTGGVLDDNFYDELESILIASDIGVSATEFIMDALKMGIDEEKITKRELVVPKLKQILEDMLYRHPSPDYNYPLVLMVVGVNGVGKTTTLGKLANKFKMQGKSVTLVAADTFRAAASSQLQVWADRADVKIIKHAEGADPGAVVYDAIMSAKAKSTDVLLIDTAGRLHNKTNLMNELKKITKVVTTNLPNAQILKYIVLDATTGQNALNQVKAFDDIVDLDGIVLTKLDGTAKGGVVLAISEEVELPVVYIGVGESLDDLEDMDVAEFIEGIVG